MVEREFAETFDTVEEDGIVESKIGGGFCVAVGGVTFGGRVGTKSKGGYTEWVGTTMRYIGLSG